MNFSYLNLELLFNTAYVRVNVYLAKHNMVSLYYLIHYLFKAQRHVLDLLKDIVLGRVSSYNG